MSDPRPTRNEGVRPVAPNEPLTTGLMNRPAEWINKQQGIRPPSQIIGERRQTRTGADAAGPGWAVIEDLGEWSEESPTSMWLTLRLVTINDDATGYDIGTESVIALVPPGFQDTMRCFGFFVVPSPIPEVVEPHFMVMQTAVVNGSLYVYQTARHDVVSFPIQALRSDCGIEDL